MTAGCSDERLIDLRQSALLPELRVPGWWRVRLCGVRLERYGSTTRRASSTPRYLSPLIPATTPPPFGVADGARVVPVNELVDARRSAVAVRDRRLRQDRHRRVRLAARQRCRPGRDLLGAAARPVDAQPRGRPARTRRSSSAWRADTMEAAAEAASPDDLFLRPRGARRHAAHRPVRDARPWPRPRRWRSGSSTCCARSSNVVRLGHLRRVEPGRLVLDDGEVVDREGRRGRALRRAGPAVPAAGADLGCATRSRCSRSAPGSPASARRWPASSEATFDDDAEKNRLCPPSPFSDTPADWCRMQVLGGRASMALSGQPRDQGVGQRGGPQPHAHPSGAGRATPTWPPPSTASRPRSGPGSPGWPSCRVVSGLAGRRYARAPAPPRRGPAPRRRRPGRRRRRAGRRPGRAAASR